MSSKLNTFTIFRCVQRKCIRFQLRNFNIKMAMRQDSMYPSKIYPRLESVDLKSEIKLDEVDFENHSEAFKRKTSWELMRALIVLRMCAVNTLVDNSLKIMRCTQRTLGRCGLVVLFKPLFYNQFVGGENANEIRASIRRLAESGMRAMLATTMEEDVGEGSNEKAYDNNCQRILETIEIAIAEETPSPMIQLKLSGLLPADLLVILGNLYSDSSKKLDLINAIARGLTGTAINMDPFYDVLNEKKKRSLEKAIERLKRIGKEAENKKVKVLVDAEYTYLNPGLSLLTLAAAEAFNKTSPIIWNTYQCYLKDALQNLEAEIDLLERLGVSFGGKIVRGAYMQQERNRAEKLQIPDPVCEDYVEACNNYDLVISYLFDKSLQMKSKCEFIVATHNEESVKFAMKRMMELNMDKHQGGVCFGQLYGMCDQVTNALANAGYAVYKSIPFGTLEEVLPYLARRASENKSVLLGARKEQSLLSKELKQRLYTKVTCCRR